MKFSIRNLLTITVIVALALGSFDSDGANAGEPTKYAELLSNSKNAWQSAKQKEVTVTWNPKAPAPLALSDSVLVEVRDGRLVAYSSPSGRDQSYAVFFYDDHVVVADGHLHTISKLPQIDPREGVGTTGHPAELLAVRLLVLTSSVPVLNSFHLKEPIKLAKSDELKLAQAIYPDTPSLAAAAGTLRTSLRSLTRDGKTTYEWFDHGGVIFRAETSKCDDEALARRRKEFQWIPTHLKSVPLPRVSEFATHLIDAKVIDSKEGNGVAIGKDGTRESDTVNDRATISLELIRVRLGERVGALTVSRASPVRVKGVTVLKGENEKEIGRIATLVDTDDAKVLSLVNQDCVAAITIPGLNAGDAGAAKVVEEAIRWMRKVDKQTDDK